MSVTVPPVVTKPFGFGADPAFITVPIPTIPPGDPRASYTQGFPPITFQPLVSGGLPPDGRDVNGILYTATAHCAYIQAGQPYLYDSSVPAALTGYGLGAQLGMLDGSGFWFNLSANNSLDPDASTTSGNGWTASYSYGIATLSSLTGGTVTLTNLQHRRATIVLQGTLTSNLQLVFPTLLREWRIVNQCAGSFTVTAKTASGTGVVIPAGSFTSPLSVYGDGTNLYPTVAPLVLPLSVAPTANSIVQRDPNGYVFATLFAQSTAQESFTIRSVICESNAGDGVHHLISKTAFENQMMLQNMAGTVTNTQVPQAAVTQHAAALFASPTLTGNPTAPTPSPGDNDTSIATTAFVQSSAAKRAAIRMTGAGSTVSAFNASGTRTSTGSYSIDVSAAGFTQLPITVACITTRGTNPDVVYASANSTASISVSVSNGLAPTSAIDRDFNLIVLGV